MRMNRTLVLALAAAGLAVVIAGFAWAGPLRAGASILPIGSLVQRVGGAAVKVVVAVGPGRSPATYDPTPRLVAALARCRVFFAVGVPCEARIVPRLKELAPGMEVVDLREGLSLMRLEDGGVDPHVWLEPDMLAVMARRICRVLARLEPEKASTFKANTEVVVRELNQLKAWIAQRLRPFRGRIMLVFHPSYGYFARAFGLRQVAIERHGKPPSARWLAKLKALAAREHIKAIFIQPQFPSAAATALARSLGMRLVELDPLPRDCIRGLRVIARRLAANL